MRTIDIKAAIRQHLPRNLVNHRILAGPLRGMRIVTSWHDYPSALLGRTERPLLSWLSHNVNEGETWLDVGAHYGYTALAMSRLVGPHGRVFAFEPMVATAGCLRQTKDLNGIGQLEIFPLGLAGCADLEVRVLGTVRGMADATKSGNGGGGCIILVKFDELWPKICREKCEIHGIKIDVQGMEMEVLRGMTHFLREQHPKLVIEFHSGVCRRTLLELLREMGYAIQWTPLEEQEAMGQYLDDQSYAFV